MIRVHRAMLTLWLALLLATAAPPALAWGMTGHRIASEVAGQLLAPGTRRALQRLLGNESLGDAAIWADRMRSNPSPFWQQEAPAYHFVDVPPGTRYRDIGAPPEGDAITALRRFETVLADPAATREARLLALRFGIHIVQDLQQPLHVGNGSDHGGNDVLLSVRGQPSNLHRLWDRHIIDAAERSIRQWLQRLQARGLLREQAGDDDPLQWIAESAALRDTLYPPPRAVGRDYLERRLPATEERVAAAGRRTAAWLNRVLVTAGSDSMAAP